MLKNITRPENKVVVSYDLTFDDGHHNGFGFPCDRDGNLLPGLSEAALDNLKWAQAHPEQFRRYNEVVRYDHHYTEPGHGTCCCGQEVILEDRYYGACQCDNCGRWYNLYGQELLPPEYWEEDPSDDEWY